MDRETVAEFVNAANDGLTARHVTPMLTRIRICWLQLDPNEREIFKNEILSKEAGSLREWPGK
jgi:hypothetical protein